MSELRGEEVEQVAQSLGCEGAEKVVWSFADELHAGVGDGYEIVVCEAVLWSFYQSLRGVEWSYGGMA